jgi:hypothetical protein
VVHLEFILHMQSSPIKSTNVFKARTSKKNCLPIYAILYCPQERWRKAERQISERQVKERRRENYIFHGQHYMAILPTYNKRSRIVSSQKRQKKLREKRKKNN